MTLPLLDSAIGALVLVDPPAGLAAKFLVVLIQGNLQQLKMSRN